MDKIRRLIQDKRGANMVEYIIVVAVIALIAIAAFRTFGNNLNSKTNEKASQIQGL
jgi:pilus assembly protein Flp/PilA